MGDRDSEVDCQLLSLFASRKTPSETNAGLEGFFAEGLRRAQAAFHVRGKSMQADDMAVQEAVQVRAQACGCALSRSS